MNMLRFLLTTIVVAAPLAAISQEAEFVFARSNRSIAVIHTDAGRQGSAVAYLEFEDGTGFLTNCHVLKDATAFTVSRNGKRAPGTLLAGRPEDDLCMVDAPLRLPAVDTRNFFTLRVGEKLYAIGAPNGLELSISEGILSQLRGQLILGQALLVQTTTAISPGSSGGGLFDAQGRLVGITSFHFKESQSLNFAVATNMANSLFSHGTVDSLDALNRFYTEKPSE